MRHEAPPVNGVCAIKRGLFRERSSAPVPGLGAQWAGDSSPCGEQIPAAPPGYGHLMAMHAFTDESKESAFFFATVVVRAGDVAAARRAVRTWLGRGQERYHAKSERERTNRKRLRELDSMSLPLRVVVVAHPRTRPRRLAREAALRELARWVARNAVSRWVIERDAQAEAADRRVIRAVMHSRDAGLEYLHAAARSEPLLWAADLVAWSLNRGGECGAAARRIATDWIDAGRD